VATQPETSSALQWTLKSNQTRGKITKESEAT
jgi:hypothetical protein